MRTAAATFSTFSPPARMIRCFADARRATSQSVAQPLPPYWPVCAASNRNAKARSYSFRDRKSTRLNSSHGYISYAVFCLKKKNYLVRQLVLCADMLCPDILHRRNRESLCRVDRALAIRTDETDALSIRDLRTPQLHLLDD